MHLSDLKYFLAVAEERSFTQASQRLLVSQPALTVSIKRLEDELGCSLLNRKRGGKEIQLTAAGESVLVHAKKILHELDILIDETREKGQAKIRLGVPPIIGAYLFPKVVKRLHKDDIEHLELIETGSEDMQILLDQDKVDMCFIGVERPIVDSSLEKFFILRDSYAIFVSPDHPLATRTSVSFSELRGERFVSLGKGFLQYKVLKRLCLQEGMREEVENFVITNKIQTAKSLISSGAGIGFMITSTLGSRQDLRVIPLELPTYFYVYLVFKKDRELSTFEAKIKENIIKANAGL